jgi:hypothetical protein
MRDWGQIRIANKFFHSGCGVCLFGLVVSAGVSLIAQDWPQFLGPDRNGIYEGVALSREWSGESPRDAIAVGS